MIRSLGALAAVCATCTCLTVGFAAAAAGASCAAPMIKVHPAVAPPGGSITVVGTYWGEGCNDMGAVDSSTPENAYRPYDGIEVHLRQGAEEWLLAAGSADQDFNFEVSVRVPDGVVPGTAELAVRDPTGWDGHGQSIPLQIVRRTPAIDPVGAGAVVPVTFGPAPGALDAAAAADRRESSRGWLGATVGATVAAVALGVVTIRRRRAARSRRRLSRASSSRLPGIPPTGTARR